MPSAPDFYLLFPYAVKELCENCSMIANCFLKLQLVELQLVGHVWKPCFVKFSHQVVVKNTCGNFLGLYYISGHLHTFNVPTIQ